MSRMLIAFIVVLYNCTNSVNQKNEILNAEPKLIVEPDIIGNFNALNDKIRDGLIEKNHALRKVQILLPKLKEYFYSHGGLNAEQDSLVFPVEGYSQMAIGGRNGSGYIPNGYDYFDGNKHRGHPAHDIFIVDRNQDCIDDNSNKHVNVLSMTPGVVIATETDWETTSALRGGKYIWIYEPYSSSLFYYAHNNAVFVKPMDIVKQGDTIATVGRTGLNAFKERSPTHLHLMQLQLDSTFYPKPVDCYNLLKAAKRK